MENCELCKLEKKTKWHFEDDFFVLLDCDTCKVPMLVLRRHDTKLTKDEKEILDFLVWKYNNLGKPDYVMRSIPQHFHLHFREEDK